MADEAVKPRSRWPRRLALAAALPIALAGGAWLGAPAALRAGLVWLAERDGSMTARIGEAVIDLNSLSVTLRDVALRPRAGQGDGVSLARLHAGLCTRALLERHVFLRDVELSGLKTALVRDAAGGWRIGGIALPRDKAPPAVPKPGGAAKPDAGWQLGIDGLAVTDATLRLADGALDQTLSIERLALRRVLAWTPEAPSTLSLAAALAGARITVAGTGKPLAKVRSGKVGLKLRALPLGILAPLTAPAGVTGLDGTLTLDMTFGGAPDGAGGFKGDAEGTLSLRDLTVATAEGSVRAAALEWAGKIGTGRDGAAGASETVADGRLTGSGVLTGHGGAQASASRLDWQGRAEFRHDPGHTAYARLRGKLALGGVRGGQGDAALRAETLSWDGWITGSHSTAADEFAANLRGALTAAALTMDGVGDGLALRTASARWQGQGEALRSKESPEILGSLDGRLDGAGIAVDATDRGLRLVEADEAGIQGLFLTLRRTAFLREGRARGVRLIRPLGADGKPGDALAETATVTLEDGGFTPVDGLRLGAMRVDGAALTLTHLGKGSFAFVPQAVGKGIAEPEAAPAAQGARRTTAEAVRARLRAWPGARWLRSLAQPAFAAHGLEVAGNSRVTLRDVTEAPPWQAVVAPVAISLGALDSAHPDHETPLAMTIGLPAGGVVTVKGAARPFIGALTGRLQMAVDRMELPALSPLSRRHLGLVLRTGRLGGTLDIVAERGRLKGSSKLGIDRLAVEVGDAAKAAPLLRRVPVPLDTALGLLRDDKGRIEMTVPVSGNVRDPKFDVSDIINQAIGSALAETARTTLKVLFPLGALASAMLSDGEVKLAPMPFAPGSAAAGPAGRDYVAQLHDLLAKRPGVTVALCGKAGPDDRESMLAEKTRRAAAEAATRPPPPGDAAPRAAPAPPTVSGAELEALANARAAAMRRLLTAGNGIDERRLLRCAPDVETRADAMPRVELRF
jgi:hypothetical protein